MKENEIDLIDFYIGFTKSAFFTKVKGWLTFIIINKWWFVLFILIGISYGYYKQTQQVPLYKSEISIKSKLLNNYDCENLINSLNTNIAEENTAHLEKIEGADAIKSIKSIEFVYPKDKDPLLLKVESFRIIVFTDDNSKFKEIENFLFNYLKNTPYSLADENKQREVFNKSKIELKNKINMLDSMQKLLVKYIETESKELPQSIDLTAIINEKTKTQLELINTESQLNNISNFEIIQNMSPTIKSYFSKKPIFIWAFLALMLGGIILGIVKKR